MNARKIIEELVAARAAVNDEYAPPLDEDLDRLDAAWAAARAFLAEPVVYPVTNKA